MFEKPRYPQQIFKPIYRATYHLTKLAEPKKSNLLYTYKYFADYFDALRLKSMALKMKNLHYAPLPNVLESYAMNKDFRKCHKSLAKRNRQIAKKKLAKLQEQYMTVILENIFESKKPYLLCSEKYPINPSPHSRQIITGEQFARLRAILLRQIEKFSKCGIQNKLIVELCNKLAIWICHFVSFSGYTMPPLISSAETKLVSESVDNLSVPSSQLFPIDHYVSYSSHENILNQAEANVPEIMSEKDAASEAGAVLPNGSNVTSSKNGSSNATSSSNGSKATSNNRMVSEQLIAEPAAMEHLEQITLDPTSKSKESANYLPVNP